MNRSPLSGLLPYLPLQIRSALGQMMPARQMQLHELRLRAARPVAIQLDSAWHFLTPQGSPTDLPTQALVATPQMLQETFQAVCDYSVYRHTQDIVAGFVTIAGGCRVGIAGTAVYQDDTLTHIRDISGLCFRIPCAAVGCGLALYQQTCVPTPQSVLILGAVGSGKTTLLRDLCRLVGDRHPTTLVDARGELAAVQGGVPQYAVGLHTDVLDGFSRAAGLMQGLRVLTPSALVCDEIGTSSDADSILQVHGCGVPVIATAHATTQEELARRTALQPLLEAGVFRYTAWLDRTSPGHLRSVEKLAT